MDVTPAPGDVVATNFSSNDETYPYVTSARTPRESGHGKAPRPLLRWLARIQIEHRYKLRSHSDQRQSEDSRKSKSDGCNICSTRPWHESCQRAIPRCGHGRRANAQLRQFAENRPAGRTRPIRPRPRWSPARANAESERDGRIRRTCRLPPSHPSRTDALRLAIRRREPSIALCQYVTIDDDDSSRTTRRPFPAAIRRARPPRRRQPTQPTQPMPIPKPRNWRASGPLALCCHRACSRSCCAWGHA